MLRVIIESPYAGDVEANVAYARRAMRDSLDRGEAPLASHLLYTQVLDDENLDDRMLGISAGFVWNSQADLVALYVDLGISQGMKAGLELARSLNIRTEERRIDPAPPPAEEGPSDG